jgi:hypothetical protein
MRNKEDYILPELALNQDADEFEVMITVTSKKYDCNTAYRLSSAEMQQDKLSIIVPFMIARVQEHIKEKNNVLR